jgi:hypothetical protein
VGPVGVLEIALRVLRILYRSQLQNLYDASHNGLASPRDRTASLFCVIIKQIKRAVEMIEGPEAFTRFQNAMEAVLSVPRSEIPTLQKKAPSVKYIIAEVIPGSSRM